MTRRQHIKHSTLHLRSSRFIFIHILSVLQFSSPPACLSLSFSLSSPLPPPLPPLRPCWIGGVNTGRERALFHYARAEPGRSCSAAALGSKVYYGFHFTFPQPITVPRCSAWTPTPEKNSTQKMGLTPDSHLQPLSSPIFPPLLLFFFSFNRLVSCVDKAQVKQNPQWSCLEKTKSRSKERNKKKSLIHLAGY